MVKSTHKFKITFGGWYQRTTLHLSEVYDLLALGHSDLKLDQIKLKSLHEKLELESVSRESGEFEYVHCVTKSGIDIRYYEDGLYVLSVESSQINESRHLLQNYYERSLSPAISYIFSLGAPTPKELAAIKTHHPTVVSTQTNDEKSLFSQNNFGPVYSRIASKDLVVYKTPDFIVLTTPAGKKCPDSLIEMQIFFREFKDQLHRYLILHREVWEEISDIKERGVIAGSEVESLRSRLDSYQKTINLIKSRINQMGTYVRTRASISKKLELEDQLSTIFQYKFETLNNTHSYVQEIWKMTLDYVDTAISVINEVKSLSTSNGINSLRLITTIGVLAGIFGHLSRTEFPSLTWVGLWYFFVLILGTWIINYVVGYIYRHYRYQLKFTTKLGI